MSDAKTMNRSRNQLATAYAPETLFTFEGGLGACISHPSAGDKVDLDFATREQIFDRLHEIGSAWFESAMRARSQQADKPPVLPAQCVDSELLDDAGVGFQVLSEDKVYLCKPSHMEYTPAPLTFTCRTCGLFKDYPSLRDLNREIPSLTPEHCPNPTGPKGNCYWEQLDVVFVHWSGNWTAAFPGQFDWRDGKVVPIRSRCLCGSYDFRLNRKSPQIGRWFFVCARCNTMLSEQWLQNDRDTLDIFKTPIGQGRLAGPTEVRMEPTPYRASSAYYVQTETFIDFKEGGGRLLNKLRVGEEQQLEDFIASNFGFESEPITDSDVIAACGAREDCKSELERYRSAIDTIAQFTPMLNSADAAMKGLVGNALRVARDSRDQVLKSLRDRQVLIPRVTLPQAIAMGIRFRRDLFSARFDPYRLAVEHATLKETRIDVQKTTEGKKRYVSFSHLDNDLSAETPDETKRLEEVARERMRQLGFADMGLIREFELCRMSFGYSRMESGPVLRGKRGMDMPVRLKLFPSIVHDERSKFPIYVIQQANQAIYVRLEERRLEAWLRSLGCDDMFPENASIRLGAGLLGAALPMDRFLERLPVSTSPKIYFYLYTLLHSFSHLLMKQIAEYSGLDLGSLSEYIFPADGAFVVYRSGTTMDLGNLSAMWRNSGSAMLTSMLAPRATQCGTGSLCTQRGGACPDCLMVPETSCIASNKLLSRSVLRSIGGRPRMDQRNVTIQGYLDTHVDP